MTDRPILFSTPMVRAILEGRKTQTRRVLALGNGGKPPNAPRFNRGDRLWVRESYYLTDDGDNEFAVYAGDAADVAEHLRTIAELED